MDQDYETPYMTGKTEFNYLLNHKMRSFYFSSVYM